MIPLAFVRSENGNLSFNPGKVEADCFPAVELLLCKGGRRLLSSATRGSKSEETGITLRDK